MSEPHASPPPPGRGLADWARRHPAILSLLVVCTVGGCAVGVWLLPAEWSLLRRAVGGAVGGAGVGLLVSATRMVG